MTSCTFYVYPTALFVHTLSVYLTILVAVQRYACLCRPCGASLFCQRQHVCRYVLAVVVFSFLFTLPRYFEFDVVRSAAAATAQADIIQNDTTSATEPTTGRIPLTSWKVAQTNFSKNRVYKIVYFNLNLAVDAVTQENTPRDKKLNCCRGTARRSIST